MTDVVGLGRNNVYLPVELVSITPGGLGLVHRYVRIFNQHLSIQPILWIEADADADGDLQCEMIDAVGSGERGEQLLRGKRCIGGVLDLG